MFTSMQKMCKEKSGPEVGNWCGKSSTALETRRLGVTYRWSGRERRGNGEKIPLKGLWRLPKDWVVCWVVHQCHPQSASPRHQERCCGCRKPPCAQLWDSGGEGPVSHLIPLGQPGKEGDVLELRTGSEQGPNVLPGNPQRSGGRTGPRTGSVMGDSGRHFWSILWPTNWHQMMYGLYISTSKKWNNNNVSFCKFFF